MFIFGSGMLFTISAEEQQWSILKSVLYSYPLSDCSMYLWLLINLHWKFFFLPCCMAGEILVPQPEIEPGLLAVRASWQWES